MFTTSISYSVWLAGGRKADEGRREERGRDEDRGREEGRGRKGE